MYKNNRNKITVFDTDTVINIGKNSKSQKYIRQNGVLLEVAAINQVLNK